MIALMIIPCAGLLILLACILWCRLRAVNQFLYLKRHFATNEGFCDLLNYASVIDDGVIINKNGSLMAAWIYKGEDWASLTSLDQERISLRINQAFKDLGSGWMIHIDTLRYEAPNYSKRETSCFTDSISQAIDDERRDFFQSLGTLYEGFFVLTVTWTPPKRAEQRFLELMFNDSQAAKPRNNTTHLLRQFAHFCTTIESKLSSELTLSRLKSDVLAEQPNITFDNFLRMLQLCITGQNHPVRLPNFPIYLDALLGGQEFHHGITPKVGHQFIQCVALEGFPSEGHPGILNILSELPINYRWSTRFIFMERHQALKHLEKFRDKWQQKVRGFVDQLFNTGRGAIDKDAQDMVDDATTAIAETNSGMVAQGYYTSVVVLMAESRELVENNALYLAKVINDIGFVARVETINNTEAYLGSLPGHGFENVRRPLLHTLNLADLLPTSSVWTGEDKAPCPLFPIDAPPLMHCLTGGSSPFRLNLHVNDLGHTIILGPTRAGKSTLLAMIALQWRRYKNCRTYVFDKGMSMYPTCKAVGGTHFVIAGDLSLAFAPLQFLDTREDRAWAMEWIDTVLALNDLQTTPHQRNEIGNAIVAMHQGESKTLSIFVMLVQDESIREALKQYTIDGVMGHLIDAPHDTLDLADFMTFEIEKLMRLGNKVAIPILLYLFRRIEQSLDGRPTLIILDEVWLMLAHPVFRKKITEWLDSMAKKNCTVVMATQRISHAKNSGILDTLVESTATKIFLPNSTANTADNRELYASMGINDQERKIIAQATPKQDYYFKSTKGCRLFSLNLGKTALAFAGATDMDSIVAIQNLIETNPQDWQTVWLQRHGVSYNVMRKSA